MTIAYKTSRSKLTIDLFRLNFNPLLKTIEDDLTRWMNLPLSIIGRIVTVQMCILTKFLYLFTMSPVLPTKKWFTLIPPVTRVTEKKKKFNF